MMLSVQKFLIDNSLKDLEDKYHIKVCTYEKFITLNYSLIESPKNDPITNECRGLILENVPPYNVVCRSFDRFYNYGENGVFPENFSEYKCFEKRDGTLINVYNYDNEWYASTRKMSYAEGVNTQGYKFSDLFFSVFEKSKLTDVDTDLVLIFELTSNFNRIVTRYFETETKLLSVRNKITGREFSYDALKNFKNYYNFDIPKEFNFADYDTVINSYDELEVLEEGYVFVNYDTMHRFKMKNPSYLAAANIRMNGIISPKNIIILIFLNDYEEYLLLFEDDRVLFQPYIDAYNKLIHEIPVIYEKIKDAKNQKEFALLAMKTKCSPILFSIRCGNSLIESFNNMSTNSKIKLINKYL
jgi:hypothetical protein